MKTNPKPCPECGQSNLYETITRANTGNGNGPNLLPRLGGLFRWAKLRIVVCAECGLTRCYADEPSRTLLSEKSNWSPL